MNVRRPVTDDDLDDMALLLTRARPDDPVDIVNFRHRDASWDHTRLWRERLGVWDGSGVLRGVVTVSHLRWEWDPDRYELQLVVCPSARRTGIGGTLHDWAMTSLERRMAISVRVEVPETDSTSLRWAQRRGYVEAGRAWEGRLVVSQANVDALRAGCARATGAGVRVTTLAALVLEADGRPTPDPRTAGARSAASTPRAPAWLIKTPHAPAWRIHSNGGMVHLDPRGDEAHPTARDAIEAALFDLDVEATADIPSVAPIVHPPFEEWRAGVLRVPGFVEGEVLVAMAGDAMVGVAYLEARASTPGVLHQGFLGVRRAWRGHGVAQLLKRATVEAAVARGVGELRTFNDAGNAAMVHINDVVGFVQATAWITLVRAVGT